MGDWGRDACSGGATSTPAESTLPTRLREDGRQRWFGAGEPAVALLVALVVALAAWRRSPGEVFLLAVAVAVVTRRRRVGVGVAVLAIVVVGRSATVHDGLVPDELGGYVGWVAVAADPDPSFNATRVLLEIEGERFETWVRGRAARLRVENWQQGDHVWVAGTRRPLDQRRAGRVAWQHVVGAFDHDVLGDRAAGGRLGVASNRVRSLISTATSSLGDDEAALARGLIVGDDSGQSEAMTDRFRRSGLSHLTAVSGQNVALALAITAPLIQRARPGLRLGATLVVIGWFVILTRAEPSVLRAGTMAALSAFAFALGTEREPPRLLATAVVVLIIVDPLLVRSIGFWLSVGATAGVTIIGPPLRTRLVGFGRLAAPLAMTAAAQLGVLVPSVLVFGQLSVSGIVANLCAVPVAGLVMLYGLPASLVAGAVPAVRSVLMAPVALGTRWVDAVATGAAALERHPPWNVVVVIVFLGGSLCVVRASGRHETGRGTQQ
jgi:competence protein ComEC